MSNANQPQFFDDVARHYAKIFKDLPQVVLEELTCFDQWIKGSALFCSLVRESSSPFFWHEALFHEFAETHPCQEMTLRILALMSAHKRLGALGNVLSALNEFTRPDRVVYLHTAQRLSDAALTDFAQVLSHSFDMPVTVHQKENTELLLGGVLLWNDSMIDLSLKRMLSNLHTEIDHVVKCS
jgi:F0F1-type ATP synthase delta subunit